MAVDASRDLWHHQRVTTPLRQLAYGTAAIAAIGVVALGAASCGKAAPMPSSEDLARDLTETLEESDRNTWFAFPDTTCGPVPKPSLGAQVECSGTLVVEDAAPANLGGRCNPDSDAFEPCDWTATVEFQDTEGTWRAVFEDQITLNGRL